MTTLTTLIKSMDFIATSQFISYKQTWIPKHLIFVNVNNSKQYSIQPLQDSLIEFTLKDIITNDALPYDPWQFSDDKDTFNVPIGDFKSFLINELYNKQWLSNADIGTLDLGTYHYLLPLFPAKKVHYLGMSPLIKETQFLCANPNIEKMAQQAACNLFFENNKESWV